MEKMASYMLGAMSAMSSSINNINNALTKQAKLNSKIKWFMVTTTIYIWTSDKLHKLHDRKIAELEKEIKELKEAKGE